MQVLSISRYFISLLLCCAASTLSAQVADTSTGKPPAKTAYKPGHQLRVSFDVSKPLINAFAENRQSYELALDYYWRREAYFVAEGGFGTSGLDYPDLSYKSTNTFFRLGIDKNMLQRLFRNDWDAAFVGIRYGLGMINRGEARYSITDPLFGNSSGTLPARNFTAHWAEITGGVRVELLRNFMVGWNVRAKFLLNPKAFNELAPAYIAGYGKGDGSTAFDFNFNLCYMIRWGAQKDATIPAQ